MIDSRQIPASAVEEGQEILLMSRPATWGVVEDVRPSLSRPGRVRIEVHGIGTRCPADRIVTVAA